MIFTKQQDMGRPILQKYLLEGMCRVIFTKVKDNSTRILLCTLNPNYLPKKYIEAIEDVLKPKVDEDLLSVWDVKEAKWKSFRISKVLSFSTEEELTEKKKDKEEAHTVESKQKEELRKRKEKAEKLHEERVQKQKEQLNQAKEIINKLREEAKQRKS